jgi:hypothetical protein
MGNISPTFEKHIMSNIEPTKPIKVENNASPKRNLILGARSDKTNNNTINITSSDT